MEKRTFKTKWTLKQKGVGDAVSDGSGPTHRVCLRRVVPNVDVGVVQGLLHGDAGFRVNHQHFGEQVACLTSCHGNKASQGGREEVGGRGEQLLRELDGDIAQF